MELENQNLFLIEYSNEVFRLEYFRIKVIFERYSNFGLSKLRKSINHSWIGDCGLHWTVASGKQMNRGF